MLRAAMIDGLGWFEKADYRRAWLFFDEVDYLLPARLTPPWSHPPHLLVSDEFRAVMDPLDEGAIELILAAADADQRHLPFRRAVGEIPADDLAYAVRLVGHDAEYRARRPHPTPAQAIAYLLDKLVWHAATTGAVPIFGRRFAHALLALKLDAWRAAQLSSRAPMTATPEQAASSSLFAAGLALGFLDDAPLAALPFATLQAFKQAHGALLARHQAHLLEVAASYRELPTAGPAMDRALAELRARAHQERERFERDTAEASRGLALDAAKSGVVAGSATAMAGIAVLRGLSMVDLVAAFAPAAAAGMAAATSSALDALARARRRSPPPMAYLFEAQRLLDEQR